MTKFFLFVALVVVLAACQSGDQSASKEAVLSSADTTPVVPDGHNAQNSLDWNGTYKGVLPCADCEGIETEIMLHTDSTYMIRTRYLGKKEKNEFSGKGTFTWMDGSTIELQGIQDSPARYLVGENKLFQLDREGKRITGGLADQYILVKQ